MVRSLSCMSATEPRYCPISTLHRKLRQELEARGGPARLPSADCAPSQGSIHGRRGTPRALTRRARPSSAGGLRVSRRRARPQRARRATGSRRARAADRACADLAARAERLLVSEATGADIEHLDLERGHRTLTITRKGGNVVTIPLAPHTARAINLVIGERTGAPVFLAADGAAARPAHHLHRRRLRRRRRPVTGAPAGKAPPDDLNRRTELPAAADPEHPAVTHRDLSANANRRSGRPSTPYPTASGHAYHVVLAHGPRRLPRWPPEHRPPGFRQA